MKISRNPEARKGGKREIWGAYENFSEWVFHTIRFFPSVRLSRFLGSNRHATATCNAEDIGKDRAIGESSNVSDASEGHDKRQ